MIGCYATGIFPRDEELVEATRLFERDKLSKKELDKAFEKSTMKIIEAQSSVKFDYVTDGMLNWQDLLRPFAVNISGIELGGLARWFNNNMFYRKPVIINEISREKNILQNYIQLKFLPKTIHWKAILPAPYTFAQLCENRYYKNKEELMFKYSEILRDEIKRLIEMGFSYIQLSDPALVYTLTNSKKSKVELENVTEALRIIKKETSVKICLQTFFGDFAKILPEALAFPVNHLGIDLYETNLSALKEYTFDKGVALGLVNSRSSLLENSNELYDVAQEILDSIYPSEINDVFICPNCDLEFLPFNKAFQKMQVTAAVASRLREEFFG